MNRFGSFFKPLMWSMALLLAAFVAGCGGDDGTPGAAGAPGAPGTPAPGTNPPPVPLASAPPAPAAALATYALTTSAGLTTTGVANIGGNVAMDAPASTCTATPAAPVVSGTDSCGMATTADQINPAITATPLGLTITGTTIRFNPGAVNAASFNATVRAVKNAVNAAWVDAFNRVGGASVPGALGGLTLAPGVYKSGGAMILGAGETLTLDATGNANPATAVWIFQVGTNLTVTGGTSAPTRVVLANGALARNVFWQVGTPRMTGVTPPGAAPSGGDVTFSAATGVANQTIFKGTILAGNTVTFAGGTAVEGRVLAGADLLDGSGTPPNTQTGGTVTTTATAGNAVTVTLPQ